MGFKGVVRRLHREKLGALFRDLGANYLIVFLEGPYAQDDWYPLTDFNNSYSTELVGDEVGATNIDRNKEVSEKKACNFLLLKKTYWYR